MTSPAATGPNNAPAHQADTIAYFRAKLAFETDVSDVASAIVDGSADFVLIDTRSTEAWKQGHLPSATHLPRAEIAQRAPQELDPSVPIVVYCWGPGCNGATRSALQLAELGYQVKEMIGGFEYWAREGFDVTRQGGETTAAADPLTTVVHADCGC